MFRAGCWLVVVVVVVVERRHLHSNIQSTRPQCSRFMPFDVEIVSHMQPKRQYSLPHFDDFGAAPLGEGCVCSGGGCG